MQTKKEMDEKKAAAAKKAAAKKQEDAKKEVATLKKEGSEIVAEITKLKKSGEHRKPGMQKRLNEISSRLRVLNANTKLSIDIG